MLYITTCDGFNVTGHFKEMQEVFGGPSRKKRSPKRLKRLRVSVHLHNKLRELGPNMPTAIEELLHRARSASPARPVSQVVSVDDAVKALESLRVIGSLRLAPPTSREGTPSAAAPAKEAEERIATCSGEDGI